MKFTGLSENGDFLFEKTSGLGKTEEWVEEISKVQEEILRIKKEIKEEEEKRLEKQLKESGFILGKEVEEITGCIESVCRIINRIMHPVISEWIREQKTFEEMVREIFKIRERIEEKKRIRKVWLHKNNKRTWKTTRQQVQSTIKYKPYELRIYRLK